MRGDYGGPYFLFYCTYTKKEIAVLVISRFLLKGNEVFAGSFPVFHEF